MKFSREVGERMLENWWVINPNSYEKHWKKGIDGSEMLIKLAKEDFGFFYKLYNMR